MRATSSGTGRGARRGPRGSGTPPPTASTARLRRPREQRRRGSLPRRSRIAARARRGSPSRESEGAAIRTRWPRSASSARRADELVDLVARRPRVRGDVGDRSGRWAPGHRRSRSEAPSIDGLQMDRVRSGWASPATPSAGMPHARLRPSPPARGSSSATTAIGRPTGRARLGGTLLMPGRAATCAGHRAPAPTSSAADGGLGRRARSAAAWSTRRGHPQADRDHARSTAVVEASARPAASHGSGAGVELRSRARRRSARIADLRLARAAERSSTRRATAWSPPAAFVEADGDRRTPSARAVRTRSLDAGVDPVDRRVRAARSTASAADRSSRPRRSGRESRASRSDTVRLGATQTSITVRRVRRRCRSVRPVSSSASLPRRSASSPRGSPTNIRLAVDADLLGLEQSRRAHQTMGADQRAPRPLLRASRAQATGPPTVDQA